MKNSEESRDFFVNVLGFDLVSDQNPQTIWVKMSETELLLRTGNGFKSPNYQETSTGLVIYTDDLAGSKTKLEERGLVFQGIDGSDKCLTFQDLDGHWFQLVNPHDH